MTDQREENGETVKKVHSDRAPEGNGSRHNSEVCVPEVKCHHIGGRGGASLCSAHFSHWRFESMNKWLRRLGHLADCCV